MLKHLFQRKKLKLMRIRTSLKAIPVIKSWSSQSSHGDFKDFNGKYEVLYFKLIATIQVYKVPPSNLVQDPQGLQKQRSSFLQSGKSDTTLEEKPTNDTRNFIIGLGNSEFHFQEFFYYLGILLLLGLFSQFIQFREFHFIQYS